MAKEPPDIASAPPDLWPPPAVPGNPAPGARVLQSLPGWQGSDVHHCLYLPVDWKPGDRYPVLVEYPGNGGYSNAYGDVCTGRVEEASLGYGISGGKGFIWAVAPFVDSAVRANAPTWWGDLDATVSYCVGLAGSICERWGGDPAAVYLCGFSRGAIACGYVGLHDDRIAGLWRGFIAHSHYDGAQEHWGYPGCDRRSAKARLGRLGGRPQFVSHEASPLHGLEETSAWLDEALAGDPTSRNAITCCALPYRNHTDTWVLRDIAERRTLRRWLAESLPC